MTISSIMVSVDLGPAAADRIRLAAGLAKGFEATLTGVAARPVLTVMPVGDRLEVERVWAIEERLAGEQIAAARALFAREATAARDARWRSASMGPSTYLAAQARAADVVVVGRHGPADADPGPMGVLPGALLMEAGRPVLVAPPGVASLAARRIVVAWKNTREARRAVHDALPFLSRAEEVQVVAVGPGADREGAEDVAAFLAGRRVGVTTHLLHEPEIGAADEILRFAEREEADLIVTGAYGHTRLREWAFGGVTRDLLTTSPLCCLMSH